VTIQAQILEIMKTLSRRLGIAMLIITHNLGVVARYADRVNVMYAGKIVETASAKELYANPRHPYTIGLLKSVPRLDQGRKDRLVPIEGVPPDLVHRPAGCSFAPRCAYKIDKCLTDEPPLQSADDRHQAACWVLPHVDTRPAAEAAVRQEAAN
jgi:oligopeptide/dipeptide ABC transporter ATP-binding protein